MLPLHLHCAPPPPPPCTRHDNCWQKWATVETYANELIGDQYPGTAPAITALLDSTMYGLNIRGLSNEGQDAHPINYKNITGLPLATPDPSSAVDPPDGPGRFPAIMSSPRQHQIQQYEAYRLFGEALAATGRNVTYSICPLIAGCDASVWNYYKPYSHLSMNQCVQQDATDTFGSLLYHIDDNNRFPERAKAAGQVRQRATSVCHLRHVRIESVCSRGRTPLPTRRLDKLGTAHVERVERMQHIWAAHRARTAHRIDCRRRVPRRYQRRPSIQRPAAAAAAAVISADVRSADDVIGSKGQAIGTTWTA